MPNENKEIVQDVQPKTYTEEDIAKLIQAETDKVRTEYSKKLKEKEDNSKTYEDKLKELEQKEKEISNKEKLLNISNTLEEKGLPKQLAKYLQGVEDLDTSILEIQGIFNSKQIDNSFKPTNHQSTKDTISKADFMKMSYADRVNLFKSNEELYKRLSK